MSQLYSTKELPSLFPFFQCLHIYCIYTFAVEVDVFLVFKVRLGEDERRLLLVSFFGLSSLVIILLDDGDPLHGIGRLYTGRCLRVGCMGFELSQTLEVLRFCNQA